MHAMIDSTRHTCAFGRLPESAQVRGHLNLSGHSHRLGAYMRYNRRVCATDSVCLVSRGAAGRSDESDGQETKICPAS